MSSAGLENVPLVERLIVSRFFFRFPVIFEILAKIKRTEVERRVFLNEKLFPFIASKVDYPGSDFDEELASGLQFNLQRSAYIGSLSVCH